MKQDIENIIKKNLPEKVDDDGFAQDPSVAFNNGFDEALSQINTSLIADEVLKVVVEATINMLKDESMLAECITKTLGYGHHYSTMPVLRGIVSEIEKKLLSEHLSPNNENK